MFGRGLGAAKLGAGYPTSYDVPLAQRTGSTWIGMLLTETGWFGLAAFGSLLVWLLLVGRRLWSYAPPASVDRALAGALPAIVALTALGAVLATVLDVRGYSIPFWLIVGVAIAADRARTNPIELDTAANQPEVLAS
jgi:hypothetical protein